MYPLRFLIAFCLLTFLPLFSEFPAAARVKPGIYGVPAPTDRVQMAIAARTTAAWDSLLKAHPQAGITRTFSAVSDSRPFGDSTTAFYLVLLLVLKTGIDLGLFENLRSLESQLVGIFVAQETSAARYVFTE